MRLNTSLIVLAFVTYVSATARQFDDFQISDGVGGDAEAESIAAFPGALDSLTGTALSDVNVYFITFRSSLNKANCTPDGSALRSSRRSGFHLCARRSKCSRNKGTQYWYDQEQGTQNLQYVFNLSV